MAQFSSRPHNPVCYESVPPEVFTNGFEGDIQTPSGHTLVCSTGADSVDIYDPSEIVNPGHPGSEIDDHTYRFTAAVMRKGFGMSLAMYVRNRNPLSETPEWRHPAIRPSCLAIRALDYFAASDLVVTNFQAHWTPLRHGAPVAADNWQQYHANLKAQAKWWRSPTAQEQRAAARNTSTGRLAALLGFTEILVVATLPQGVIQPIFTRSDAAARAHCDQARASNA